MNKYADLQVVLDEPTGQPSLGFDAYSSALANLIIQSAPRFAIGIFGGWGSGKTSLMKAIQLRLGEGPLLPRAPAGRIVTVWFNPWRYEREEHLIVPMLDTLREALVEWSKSQPLDAQQRAVKAASTGTEMQAFSESFPCALSTHSGALCMRLRVCASGLTLRMYTCAAQPARRLPPMRSAGPCVCPHPGPGRAPPALNWASDDSVISVDKNPGYICVELRRLCSSAWTSAAARARS